jgi:hypothetical protein
MGTAWTAQPPRAVAVFGDRGLAPARSGWLARVDAGLARLAPAAAVALPTPPAIEPENTQAIMIGRIGVRRPWNPTLANIFSPSQRLGTNGTSSRLCAARCKYADELVTNALAAGGRALRLASMIICQLSQP